MTAEEIFAAWDRVSQKTRQGKELITYALVAPEHVAKETRRAGELGSELACAELGVERPQLLWFSPEAGRERAYRREWGRAEWASFRSGPILGISHHAGRAIGLSADQTRANAVNTAAHEIRHLAQSVELDADDAEADALDYGQRLLDRIVTHRNGREVMPGTLHRYDRFPYPGRTSDVLRGVAEQGDVLLAPDLDGKIAVYRNDGLCRAPRWVKRA